MQYCITWSRVQKIANSAWDLIKYIVSGQWLKKPVAVPTATNTASVNTTLEYLKEVAFIDALNNAARVFNKSA